ncbi:Proline-rich protein 3, partial [Galemys pyrenaicus]
LPEVKWREPQSHCPSPPRKRKQNPSVPLPHCPPNPAAAIAATTMPKRKKQNQQQQPPQQQQLALPEREDTGDEEDGSPIGPPSLLGPPPMANGKPGDPKSALHRGPPESRGPMIPALLSLPPPPRGRGPIRGGLGPRSGPYGRGWWGVNAEPPFPGPGHGGPSRGGFHKEQRNPRRLKSWSLIKNTCPPKDGPQIMEDKSGRPVCRHFATKGHCRYEDLCAFYHPGVNGPPLLEGALCDLAAMFPCGPVMATVRLFHPPPSISDAHPHPPSPPFGVQSCVSSLLRGVRSSDPASRDLPLGPHLCTLQLPPGSSSPSPNDC